MCVGGKRQECCKDLSKHKGPAQKSHWLSRVWGCVAHVRSYILTWYHQEAFCGYSACNLLLSHAYFRYLKQSRSLSALVCNRLFGG